MYNRPFLAGLVMLNRKKSFGERHQFVGRSEKDCKQVEM